MSYIIRSGNLAEAPTLRHSESGAAYTYATVLVNDRERQEDGSYKTISTVRYSLTVYRSEAENLVKAAEASGNVRLVFAGRYRVKEFRTKDGGLGISHDVQVDELGVSLQGQTVTVAPHANQPQAEAAGERREDHT